jgi:hypothetical protein
LLCLIIYSSFYLIVNWCVVICLRFVTAIFYMNLVFVFFSWFLWECWFWLDLW